MKRTFTLALLALVFAIPLHAAPALEPDPQSVALIAALRLQNIIAHTSGVGVTDAQTRGEGATQAIECTTRFLVKDLGTELALLVPTILTREEIIAAVKFFESPTGRKLMAHNLAMYHQQRDGKPDPNYPDPAPSAEDTQRAKSFLATPAGKKINETGYLLNAPETQKLVKAKSDAASAFCKTQAPAAKKR
jgi:hypothetical protein